jgi:AraC-like DNA-binding protein
VNTSCAVRARGSAFAIPSVLPVSIPTAEAKRKGHVHCSSRMLFAKGALNYGPTSLTLHVALSRNLEIQTTERRACRFDTRFLAPRDAAGKDRVIFHVYLAGHVEVMGLPPLECPFAMLSTEGQYYGATGEKPVPLRAWGDPYLKIEIRVRASDAMIEAPAAPTLLSPGEAFWKAARDYAATVDASASDANACESAARDFSMNLVRAGWLGARAFGGMATNDAAGLTRLWDALMPSFAVIDMNASLKLLSTRAGITTRHIARNVEALFERIGSPIGFRAFLAEHRLRIAVILLSAPHARLEEIAELAGYSSADSLAAAMRDAGLPPAGQLKRLLDEPLQC